jgi:E3 ubiquitin-protein ligase HERC1
VLRDIRTHGESLDQDSFDSVVNENFVTYLSNGEAVDLLKGGKEKPVTSSNYKEFIELVTKVRLSEATRQFEWIKEGINHIIDLKILAFLTWEELEVRACGNKDVEVDALKSISEYSVDANHPMVVMFWKMFESLTQDERRKYLKFVWGRTKIPSDTSGLRYQHQISVYDYKPKDSLPESHTCFF